MSAAASVMQRARARGGARAITTLLLLFGAHRSADAQTASCDASYSKYRWFTRTNYCPTDPATNQVDCNKWSLTATTFCEKCFQ